MPNLVLVPQSEVLTPIFQVSCPTSGIRRTFDWPGRIFFSGYAKR